MVYIRHRDRMVQESVFQDLKDTLIACRWTTGTTSRKVRNPATGALEVVTTTAAQLLKLLNGHEVKLIDYFPESGLQDEESRTPPNTMAIDTGRPQDPTPLELGSRVVEQPYLFALAFYATSDAVALAVGNDLRDRYEGRIVDVEFVSLYNFLDDGSKPVVRMEVDWFRYGRDAEAVAPHEVHLYFGELAVTDFVD